MVYEYFKVSDTDESVLDLNEISKVELKNDSMQSFSTRWDETIVATRKQPDDAFWRTYTIVSFSSQSS